MLELRDYQKEGVKFLCERKHALLADEMGLGKTAQSIRAADEIKAHRILVLCPGIARQNWLDEFHKFSQTKRQYQIIDKRLSAWDQNSSIIASYDAATHCKDFGKFDLLILDEAHYLKNHESKRARKVFARNGFAENSKRVWAMTGTPMPNHPGELWLLAYMFGATKLWYWEFAKRYCITEENNWGGINILGAKHDAVKELKEVLNKFMMKRTKDGVGLQLPKLTIYKQYVEEHPIDLHEHKGMMQFVMNREDGMRELKNLVTNEMTTVNTALKNVRTDFEALNTINALSKSLSTLRYYTGLRKAQSVVEIVTEELENNMYGKVLVFCIHRDVVAALMRGLARFNPVSVFGGNSPTINNASVRRFKHDQHHRVMVANIQTAGTAINLTEAHHVIFAEMDWVPGNNAQAMMRCHRMGQTKPVTVRVFSLQDGVDERINTILARKSLDIIKIFDDAPLTQIESHGNVFSDSIEIEDETNGVEAGDDDDNGNDNEKEITLEDLL